VLTTTVCTVAQEVICRALTSEPRVRSKAKWLWGRILSEYFGSPLSSIFNRCSVLINLLTTDASDSNRDRRFVTYLKEGRIAEFH
jgi:hypothetical protein